MRPTRDGILYESLQQRHTILAMKFCPRLALLVPLAALAGCTVSSPPATGTASVGNWQFQAGSTITSPPDTYPNFVGALQIQGSQASGILSTTVSAVSGAQSLSFVSVPPATTAAAISTVTAGWELNFSEPSTPYTTIPVGVTGGCVGPPSSPPLCTAITAVPSVGVEIAPLTGNYTGTLSNSTTPSLSGTTSIAITQSTTPGPDGSFPLTANLVLPAELGTYSGSGSVIGEGVTLSYLAPMAGGPSIAGAASTNPTATQIVISNLTFTQAGTSYSFSGTLLRQ
jgi:hypothetical protein